MRRVLQHKKKQTEPTEIEWVMHSWTLTTLRQEHALMEMWWQVIYFPEDDEWALFHVSEVGSHP